MEESTAIEKTTAPESSTTGRRSFMRRLHYWWSLFVAGALLGMLGPPILLFSWLVNKHDLGIPVGAVWRAPVVATEWVRVRVRGLELLDAKQPYVFVSNHRSYRHCGDVYLHG